MGSKKRQQPGPSPVETKEMIRAAASGRTLDVLENVAGIPREFLSDKEGPCPKCGGNTRFRVVDEAAGAVFCSHCFSKGSGDFFAAIQWYRGLDFQSAMVAAGEYLGVKGVSAGGYSGKSWRVIPQPWNDLLVATWCLSKPPITPAAVQRIGGQVADYGHYTVLALPVMGEDLRHDKPVGWIVYNITGGTLPKKNDDGTYDQVKVKLSFGTQPGIVGNPDDIRACSTLMKVEGSTDLLAWLSAGLPEGAAAFTNSSGAGQYPLKWMSNLAVSRDAIIVHDCDTPGQDGAMQKWGPELAKAARTCRNVTLPYPIEQTHGKDSRDYIQDGGTFVSLLSLPYHEFSRSTPTPVEETVSDPHRLARINLARYAELTDGGTLRYWNDQHYTWKQARGCWKSISPGELRAKVTAAIKAEFNRHWIEQIQSGQKVEPVGHVTSTLVSNVIAAMNSSIILPSSVPLQSWVESDDVHSHRNLISVANGLIDVDALLDPNVDSLPDDRILLPHSPKWFSMVRLPYAFDPQARSDAWEDSIYRSFDGNLELCAVSQEWAGYSLVASTDFQKFLCLEGDGRNGKSVFLAGLQAIVGVDNCSFMGLEDFGDSFAAADTVGKLLNISADCGEIERVAEGVVKKFASGDRMAVNRKGLPRITLMPTARLVVAFNTRPRFSDKTGAIWRRMILLPFRRRVADKDVVLGMDKAEFWYSNGHAPGMLNWALRGLIRLYRQRRFTACTAIDAAVESYRLESNPARVFILEHLEQADENSKVGCSEVYRLYRKWCSENGYSPVNDTHFGAEIYRTLPMARKARPRGVASASRTYAYSGLKWSVDEICGERIDRGGF